MNCEQISKKAIELGLKNTDIELSVNRDGWKVISKTTNTTKQKIIARLQNWTNSCKLKK